MLFDDSSISQTNSNLQKKVSRANLSWAEEVSLEQSGYDNDEVK